MTAQPAPPPGPSGLLIVDKPLRLTSMTVCRAVKRRLVAGGAAKSVKVGHGGTLDPFATGVVVVLVGKATKLCDLVMTGEKRYEAEVDLSRTSTTDDREGEFTDIAVARPPSRDDVAAACRAFVGTIMQRPPAHSAIWVEGTRSYHLARRGEGAELPARPVTIHALELTAYDWPLVTLDVRCGKGTYIRSLARDLGKALGTGGMLAGLRRTAVGDFTLARATPLNDLPDRLDQSHLIPVPQVTPG